MKIFLNLLPSERKDDIVKRFYWRFFLGQLFLLLLIAIGGVVVMAALTFRVYLKGQEQQATVVTDETAKQQAEYTQYEEKFEEANRSVRSTAGFLALHTSFSELLYQIEMALPPGTKIEKISTTSFKVFLTGSTDTRDTFLQLEQNIKNNTCFESVNTPLSNLFSETNVQFEIDFIVKPQCLRGSVPKL